MLWSRERCGEMRSPDLNFGLFCIFYVAYKLDSIHRFFGFIASDNLPRSVLPVEFASLIEQPNL